MKPATSDYAIAFLTVLDCTRFIRGETYEPFLKMRETHGNEREACIRRLKRTGAAAFNEFKQKNRTDLNLGVNYTSGIPSNLVYSCEVSTKEPVVNGEINMPCIDVSLEKEIERTPAQILSSLGELKKMRLGGFFIEGTPPKGSLPIKSFSKGRIVGIIGNASGSIDLISDNKPPRLSSTFDYDPQKQHVVIKYEDDGKLLRAKPETISKEREWLE